MRVAFIRTNSYSRELKTKTYCLFTCWMTFRDGWIVPRQVWLRLRAIRYHPKLYTMPYVQRTTNHQAMGVQEDHVVQSRTAPGMKMHFSSGYRDECLLAWLPDTAFRAASYWLWLPRSFFFTLESSWVAGLFPVGIFLFIGRICYRFSNLLMYHRDQWG